MIQEISKVEEALQLAGETQALEIGRGIIEQTGVLFQSQFPDKIAIIVADKNTYAIGGDSLKKSLKKSGVSFLDTFIFEEDSLYAEYSFVQILIDNFKKHNAIPIALGSGTINDLVKLASYETGRRYMCVATAASMDGYTAFGASITANGAKQTFSCPAPQACLVDMEIVANAPKAMTASGYADLFAKITAGADWILADRLKVEAIDKKSWDIVQGGLQEALGDPAGVAKADIDAIEKLIEGLMLGGFAMQSHKSSRPASGAEHQFSHLWNMEHHTNNGKSISHGFQVAIGTLAITALYEEVLKSPLESLDIDACCQAWPTAEELAEEAKAIFKNTDFPEIGYVETKAKYVTKEELREQLTLLKSNWNEIKEDLKKQLIPFPEAKRRLQQVGAPVNPEDIGVSRDYLRQTYIRSQYIRRRFTILDLVVRTNSLEYYLDKLFGAGGVWEIKKD